jgi:hypothetical protein
VCLCVSTPLAVVQVARGYKFFSPPKFSFTPEPVYLNTKRRRQSSVPLSSHYPVRSNHAALAVVSEEECNRLGSESIGLLCVSRRDGLSVAVGGVVLQHAILFATHASR